MIDNLAMVLALLMLSLAMSIVVNERKLIADCFKNTLWLFSSK